MLLVPAASPLPAGTESVILSGRRLPSWRIRNNAKGSFWLIGTGSSEGGPLAAKGRWHLWQVGTFGRCGEGAARVRVSLSWSACYVHSAKNLT